MDGATILRDEQWSTWTCSLGWPVQGIWKGYHTDEDVQTVERSHKKFKGEYNVLASGDDYGQLRLYRYPCISPGSLHVAGHGHSSGISNIAWS